MKRKYNVLGTTFRYILPIPCESPCFFLTKNMSLNNLSSRQCIPVFQGADFINSSGSVENESPPTLTSRYINNDVHLNHDLVITPRKKGILFSVCLSVRLTVCPGRFFSHFVRVTPPTVFITHKQNLYHRKAECLECVMEGVSFFVSPKILAK